MKFLQSAICGFFLTVAAAAQTATPAPATTAPKPATPSPISSLGGDAPKGPEHPLTLDQMKIIYSAMGYDTIFDQSRILMISRLKQSRPFIPDDVWDDLDSSSKKADYVGAFYDVYKKYLSVDDAAKLIDFSKTPEGKVFLTNLPAISGESAAAVQKVQQQVGQEVQARHKDELDAAMKKYREEHAPKPAPSLGAPTPGSSSGSGAPAGSGSSSAPAASPAPAAPPASTTPPQN
jgi:hypothetical protein